LQAASTLISFAMRETLSRFDSGFLFAPRNWSKASRFVYDKEISFFAERDKIESLMEDSLSQAALAIEPCSAHRLTNRQ
jgi:hypothetical protein